MATFAAAKQTPWLNLGSQQAGIWKITHDGTTATFRTGLHDVVFAVMVSETDSGALDMLAFNSSNGTTGNQMGSVYFDNEDDGDITYMLVIGH